MFNIGLLAAKWARLTPEATAVIDATNDSRVNFADFDRYIDACGPRVYGY